MPPAWPKEIREAVWAMRCDGMMPTEITRAVNQGCDELNGIAYDVKRATVVAWLEKFYKERGKPESNIPVGTELDVANAELRTILTWAKSKRKEVMARGGKLDADVAAMTKIASLIARTEAAIRESKVTKDQDAVAHGKSAKKVERGILNKIAADERREASRSVRKPAPDADDESPGDASPESPQPDTRGPSSNGQSVRETDPFSTSGVGYPD